jgi:signal transduction histidine kinase/CheY-like chemotaxis protein/HPt (histidine-containing phosphotransfer) domain-containing protein
VSGRRTPSIRGLLKALLGVVVVLAVLLSIVTLLQVRTATKRSEAERQRVTSFRLSDGMRQSSNDLTRMVRLYVTTGDPRYRRYYDEILAIRSGDAPRPLDYDSSFWDRVLADGDGKVRRGPPAALTELMRRAHFSTDEFAALAASLRASNDLALLELQMMNMVAPRIAAGVDRDYLREVAPRYARLVDGNYHAQKRKIMEAIDRFTALVDARTARRAQDLQGSTDRLLAVQTAILVLLAAVLAAALVVAARSIVRPLSRLADVTRRITLGDWSQRAEPHGVAELTQLAGDFNEMADAIENDLAGRRIAEREAREAENRLQTIADRVPGAVFQFHIDADGGFNVRFTSRHGSIHRLARNQDGDFPGMARVVLPEDRGGWLDTMLTAARSGRPWAHEYRIHTPDGAVAWMQGQALTVKNPDGSAELYGFVADVTERKALEADLRRAREDAEAADRAKSAFLAMMSHELRTPLVAVTGTLEILALDALDERQRELVDVAMGSARALLAVIGDVLDFSKIEAGFLDLAPVTVAVGPLVSEVVGQHRHAARLRGLELTTTLDPALGAALGAAHVVDAGRLRQVLGNLLSNAMKFTREGGVTVDVTVLDGGGANRTQRVALAVSDTGIGIAAEDQRRLFVPFTQASTDHARSSEGTGLGLAICRQLVEAMGGTVTLDSAPGAGTTVTVELPLAVGASADAEPVPETDGVAGRRMLPASREAAEDEGSLVLLVEDHPVNRQVLAAQLEAIGFRVDTAGDAAEALERFDGGRYGLVFTDIQLPHVDGYELARRMREAERATARQRTPLLALTASALQGERERCRAVGMDDVVTKPTTMAILAGTLRRWLPHVDWPEPVPGNVAPPARNALPPAVDGSALDELVAGDAELGAQILASYATSIQDEVAQMAEALDENDREALRRVAHQVASASRAVGAGQAADAAERLEQAAGAGDGHEELADRLRDLRDALVAVMPVGS